VCIEALSVTLDRKALEESAKSVNLLQKRVADMKASDSNRLAKEVLIFHCTVSWYGRGSDGVLMYYCAVE
jgi:hypothetical protein